MKCVSDRGSIAATCRWCHVNLAVTQNSTVGIDSSLRRPYQISTFTELTHNQRSKELPPTQCLLAHCLPLVIPTHCRSHYSMEQTKFKQKVPSMALRTEPVIKLL